MAGGVVLPPHLIGDKIVRVTVDKENRNLALGRGGLAVGGFGVKVAKQDRTQPPDGVGGPDREAGQILRQALAGDGAGAGVAAVGHNAADVGG